MGRVLEPDRADSSTSTRRQPETAGQAPWLRSGTPHVVLPRRGGKTWLAKAVQRAWRRSDDHDRDALYVNLNNPDDARDLGLACLVDEKSEIAHPAGTLVIVDEPSIFHDQEHADAARRLAEGLRSLHRRKCICIVLATPNEASALLECIGDPGHKDKILPPSLHDVEIARMIERSDWAAGVVDRLRADANARHWLRTPFLLELILGTAELHPRHRDDITSLAREAVEKATDFGYVAAVLGNGLTLDQRRALRRSRWADAGVQIGQPPPTTLMDIALRRGAELATSMFLNDPILDQYLPHVLRIHHISDLHVGGAMRKLLDAKDKSVPGRRLTELVGQGTPLHDYLNRLDVLKAQGKAPHLLIVTGDLVDRPGGDVGKEALIWLRRFEERLAPHPDLEGPTVLLVGGNHERRLAGVSFGRFS